MILADRIKDLSPRGARLVAALYYLRRARYRLGVGDLAGSVRVLLYVARDIGAAWERWDRPGASIASITRVDREYQRTADALDVALCRADRSARLARYDETAAVHPLGCACGVCPLPGEVTR